jgi:hypothetical protein
MNHAWSWRLPIAVYLSMQSCCMTHEEAAGTWPWTQREARALFGRCLLGQIVEILVDDAQVVEGLGAPWVEVGRQLVHAARLVRLAVLGIRYPKIVHDIRRLSVVKQCLHASTKDSQLIFRFSC